MALRFPLAPMRRVTVAMALVLAAGVAGCGKKDESAAAAANLNAANKVSMRSVRLYFESPRMLLAVEQRNVALPENAAGALPMVVRELMKGPAASGALGRLFPADTVVRGAYLLPGGTVVVDLGGPTLSEGWGTGTHQELMAIHSLALSLTANFPEAQRLRLVVNGMPRETLGGHIALERSFGTPAAGLIEPASR